MISIVFDDMPSRIIQNYKESINQPSMTDDEARAHACQAVASIVPNGLPPFSDSTIEDTLDQEVRDSMQAEVDRTLAISEAFWAKTSQRNNLMRKVNNRYRDGDWFESCKPDDHN